MNENINCTNQQEIIHLKWNEHIRMRPGMYIGATGDGKSADDGIYILLKEVMDNSIDEFTHGYGKLVEVKVDFETKQATVRDYGRGIPLDKMVDCVSQINTGRNFNDNETIGMNGVGTKAVNALSKYFKVECITEGNKKSAEFSCGLKINETNQAACDSKSGTLISFIPDEKIFANYQWLDEYIEKMLWNYAYVNSGLTIVYNGTRINSKNGLKDLILNNVNENLLYEPIYAKDENFEFAITHTSRRYGEEYYSFVNGQFTSDGGTHQQAFRESIVKTVREFYKRDFDPADIRNAIVGTFLIKIRGPLFSGQTKTRLSSTHMSPNGQTIRTYMNDVIGRLLDNYLHMHKDIADAMLKKILDSERERKAIAGVQKIAREKAKKVNLHNKKLRDCRFHYGDKNSLGEESTLFITEGDSASGSITKSRDVNTQAVFSLRGKPLNCFGKTKKIVYENDEFNLLQAALDIEESVDNVRYKKVVIATDADVDGMHIRLLLLTFFLQFFPELVRRGHVYILQTPLFRVRKLGSKKTAENPKSKKKDSGDVTYYCYNDEERQNAISELGPKAEITRFKGLGEISPDEFENFIDENMRLEKVRMSHEDSIAEILEFYMGDNTRERYEFIVNNLRYEEIENVV